MSEQSAPISPLKKWLRRVILAFTVISSLFLIMVLYVSLIPPSTTLHPKRPTIEKVLDQENAWLEYKLAIDEIESDTGKGLDFNNSSDLTAEQNDYIKRHTKAIEHLLTGAKRPHFQYNSELSGVNTKFIPLITLRNLSSLAIAQASLLEKEGKANEAIELKLALYHMGSQIAEPYSPMITLLISKTCRGIANKALFKELNKATDNTATYAKIAKQITEDNLKTPTAYEAIDWEWQFANRSLEDSMLNQKTNSSDGSFDNLPKNVRLRVFNSYMEKQNQMLEMLKPSLENWDFNGLHETNKKINDMLNEGTTQWYKKPFIGDYIASVLLSIGVPNYDNMVKTLYSDRADASALQTLATILAYQKAHGNFPENLEPAFQELGLKVPTDPTTKKPISYRLENGKPIVWLAGVDGKDDGGKTPYDKDIKTAVVGSDLIYILGELPSHLN